MVSTDLVSVNFSDNSQQGLQLSVFIHDLLKLQMLLDLFLGHRGTIISVGVVHRDALGRLPVTVNKRLGFRATTLLSLPTGLHCLARTFATLFHCQSGCPRVTALQSALPSHSHEILKHVRGKFFLRHTQIIRDPLWKRNTRNQLVSC